MSRYPFDEFAHEHETLRRLNNEGRQGEFDQKLPEGWRAKSALNILLVVADEVARLREIVAPAAGPADPPEIQKARAYAEKAAAESGLRSAQEMGRTFWGAEDWTPIRVRGAPEPVGPTGTVGIIAERDALKAEVAELRSKQKGLLDANIAKSADLSALRGRLDEEVRWRAAQTRRAESAERTLADFRRRLCEVIAEKG